MLHCAFGGVTDQAARITHFVHDFVTSVNTGCATDTLVLQAVADVDADGADLYAHGAVDTVAQAAVFFVGGFFACTARFAAFGIVGNNQRVFVKHRTLEACIRAHMQTHFFAHDVGKEEGHESVKCCGKHCAAACCSGE